MEVDALLYKLLHRSLCLNISIAVGLQVSNIGDGNIQKPKNYIRTFLIDYHDVEGPNNHDCQGHTEEYDKYDYCRLLCAVYGHIEALKSWVNTGVIVVEEELGVIENEAVVIEVVKNETLCPNEGWLQTDHADFSIVVGHSHGDVRIEGYCIVLSNRSIVGVYFC